MQIHKEKQIQFEEFSGDEVCVTHFPGSKKNGELTASMYTIYMQSI